MGTKNIYSLICLICLTNIKFNKQPITIFENYTLGGRDLIFFIARNPVGARSTLDPSISSWRVEDAIVGRVLFNDNLIGLIFTGVGDALCLNKIPISLL